MEAVISVKDLVQKIGKKTVLNGLSFEVFSGECFGLFGTRGTGKTSLLHILAGIDRFKSGSVEVLGNDIRKGERFKAHLGLVTQERSLFGDLKVYENLDFIGVLKNADKKNIPPLVERFDLKAFLNDPVSTLEAGVYQRVSMACALLNTPKLLLADQLIDDLDLYSRQVILRELAAFLSGGGACVWGFSRVELCPQMSRMAWLENGKLTCFQPQEFAEQWEGRMKALAAQSGEADA